MVGRFLVAVGPMEVMVIDTETAEAILMLSGDQAGCFFAFHHRTERIFGVASRHNGTAVQTTVWSCGEDRLEVIAASAERGTGRVEGAGHVFDLFKHEADVADIVDATAVELSGNLLVVVGRPRDQSQVGQLAAVSFDLEDEPVAERAGGPAAIRPRSTVTLAVGEFPMVVDGATSAMVVADGEHIWSVDVDHGGPLWSVPFEGDKGDARAKTEAIAGMEFGDAYWSGFPPRVVIPERPFIYENRVFLTADGFLHCWTVR